MAKECDGVETILGIDGEYVRNFVHLNEQEFLAADLTKEIKLNRKYDLAISLEVAEHLPASKALTFVKSITNSSSVVLFSAAVPYQHGTLHVNEQYASYWENLFNQFGFECCDCLREKFWNDTRVKPHYRQNMFLYCKRELLDEVKKLFAYKTTNIRDCIHPDMWKIRNSQFYIFPFDLVEKGRKLCIYGGGQIGQNFVNQLLQTNYAEKLYLCDTNAKDIEKMNIVYKIPCVNPKDINWDNVDKVIIAVKSEVSAYDIKNSLLTMKVDSDKVIWRDYSYKNEII
jgi:hypothetical protein